MIGKEFVTAGRAFFTVDNGKGEHFTYKVSEPKPKAGEVIIPGKVAPLFLSVLTGPDNWANYTYAGMVDRESGELKATKGSKITSEAKSWKVGAWALSVIWGKRQLPDGYNIRHAGKCGRCGRMLTEPHSLDIGIGPECREIMGIA